MQFTGRLQPHFPTASKRSETMLKHTCRRSFLKSAALGGSAIGLNALQYSRVYGANGRMGIASVGVGGKGWSDLIGVAASPNVEVIAVCDIDSSENHLGRAAVKYPSARQYADWRRLQFIATCHSFCCREGAL